jgi:hypothetical protein
MNEQIQKAAETAQYVGASSAVFFGLTAEAFAALVGATVAVLGFVVSCIFKYKIYKVIKSKPVITDIVEKAE